MLQGEAGSGKTHLMRAFRNWTHSGGKGYCGYMQMTSATSHYGRYVLNNLIDSLDQPYDRNRGETSGLMRLSTAIAEGARGVPTDRLDAIRGGELEPPCLAKVVEALADQIVMDPRFDDIDIDLVRALLYLQADDPRIKSRVLKYLRCEDLSQRDRQMIGDLVPRTYDDAPQRVVQRFGELMAALESVPLVLCVDQLEDIYDLDEAPARFRRAMATLCDLVSRLPTAIVVISCLETFYDKLKEHLTRPMVDRIETDPKPILLKGLREEEEIREILSRRLSFLYEELGASFNQDEPTYPISRESVRKLAGMRTRDVLARCQDYRERCVAAGRLLKFDDTGGDDGVRIDTTHLERLWNDHRSAVAPAVPDADENLAEVLAWAIGACSDEIETGHRFEAEADGWFVPVECHDPEDAVDHVLIGVCNKSARGGSLGRQVSKVVERASGAGRSITPALVRSTSYPSNPQTQIAGQLGKFLIDGGRRTVVEDTEWRMMLAMRSFRPSHEGDPAFGTWLKESRPLSNLKSLQTILRFDDLKSAVPERAVEEEALHKPEENEVPKSSDAVANGSAANARREPKDEEDALAPERIVVGTENGFRGGAVELSADELTRHAAFLGSPGSGKTTVALNIVEQLLLRGIPAILVDRKGDLCGYAREDAWSRPIDDPVLSSRRDRLRERVEVAVYTPGRQQGRPLSIAVAPAGLGRFESIERGQVAKYAASALAGMMSYRTSGADQTKQVILSKAIETLAQLRLDEPVTLDRLVDYLASQDDTLVNAIGYLDTKHINKLLHDMEVLRLSRGALLSATGEPLSIEALFGLGPHARPGKTRLSVVSTRFLGAEPDVQFWVSQLLVELSRWASRSPSPALQAVVLFDEADLYLPALRKPPTKEPMENLLKRARSAGLGLLLATQSPGDFDYKGRDNIRAWFLGKITQDTSIAKMRPMLNECRSDVADTLPGQQTGEFVLARDGDVARLRAGRSVLVTEQLAEDEILDVARSTLQQLTATHGNSQQ